MSARKVIEAESELGRFRIVRAYRGSSVVEFSDGHDWLGVARWQTAQSHENHRDKFRTLTVDGVTDHWVQSDVLRGLINAIGDELMRQMKRGRNRRAKR